MSAATGGTLVGKHDKPKRPRRRLFRTFADVVVEAAKGGSMSDMVVKGWVVVKSFKKNNKNHTKIVSRVFASRSAADRLCELANRRPNIKSGETDVSYYTTTDICYDGLPEGL